MSDWALLRPPPPPAPDEGFTGSVMPNLLWGRVSHAKATAGWDPWSVLRSGASAFIPQANGTGWLWLPKKGRGNFWFLVLNHVSEHKSFTLNIQNLLEDYCVTSIVILNSKCRKSSRIVSSKLSHCFAPVYSGRCERCISAAEAQRRATARSPRIRV